MSYSSLYGIKADYTGEILCEYKNSWWFSPVVWSVLSDKTLPKVMGYIQSVIGMHGADVWKKINTKMNKSRISFQIETFNIKFRGTANN